MEKKIDILLSDVSKMYDGNEILKNINLEVEKGEFISIFGKSGSGKTTILNIVGSLEDYENGTVNILGEIDPIKDKKKSMMLKRNGIGYIFQSFALVENMTVFENLRMAVKYRKDKNLDEEIKRVAETLGISDKLTAKIYQLSGGEAQRVSIARNMLKPCSIILADEPTGSLDEENKQVIINILKELNKLGKTVLVVSHDADFLDIADKSYMVEDGKLERIR